MQLLSSLVLGLLSVIFALLEWYTLTLLLSLASYGFLLTLAYRKAGWNSVFFLFVILFGLYGFSVPLSVWFNLDIGWHRVAKLKTWEKVDNTLYSFIISNQLALLGVVISCMVLLKNKYLIFPPKSDAPKLSYLQLAVVSGVFSSLSEGLNFIRVGGFEAIAQGKAYYQGAVSDLVLNIPYEGFFFMSMALFGLYLGSVRVQDVKIKSSFIYLTSIFFVLFTNVLIGERGLLLVSLAIFILSYTSRVRRNRIKISYVLGVAVFYFLFSVLTLVREKTVSFKGPVHFIENYGTRLVKLMNPANSEFGASAFNYRIFIENKPEDYSFSYGKTYCEVIWSWVPTYVYPNKPKSIIYEFRDTYFPERKKMGSTAGTGFSSLMEAYMNFGYFGSFLIYTIAGSFLLFLEIKRRNNNLFYLLLYFLSFNIYLIFSRSASQYILFNLTMYIVQISLVFLSYKLLPKTLLKQIG